MTLLPKSINFFAAFLITGTLLLLTACNDHYKGTALDSPTEGVINISVDESYKPIIDEQIKVFESAFPGAKIIAHYKTEADCFKDFYNDTSNRMIIVTRGLNDQEDAYFLDTLKFYPHWDNIANDAITIIVNAKSNDKRTESSDATK